MAVTHADLEMAQRSKHGGRRGLLLMILCTLLGVAALCLCLSAEAWKSTIVWVYALDVDDAEPQVKCIYTSNGSVPLTCAISAMTLILISLIVGQTFLCTIVFPVPDNARAGLLSLWLFSPASDPTASLGWQSALCFILSWVCFSVTVVLLLIGITVEADHLANWSTYHPQCMVVRQGVFITAGIFALASTLSSFVLYLSARELMKLQGSRQQSSNSRSWQEHGSTSSISSHQREPVIIPNTHVYLDFSLKG